MNKRNPSTRKTSDFWLPVWNLQFDRFLLLKVYKISAKKYTEFMSYDTEEWCKIWRKTDLWFGKWLKKFGWFSPEHLKVSKLGLWRDSYIQRRKYISLKFTEELCVMTLKNDAKFEEEMTCCFKINKRNFTIFYSSTR